MIQTEKPAQIRLRRAGVADLDTINWVIEQAVKTWHLPERVIRLALPTYLYSEYDLQHLHVVIAEGVKDEIFGVAAWEDAVVRECPAGKRGLLLHGLYVAPDSQRLGIGRRLLSAAADAAKSGGYDGLLVKAQTDAEGFFSSSGLQRLAVADDSRDYPNRFWLDTRQA